MNNVLRNYN